MKYPHLQVSLLAGEEEYSDAESPLLKERGRKE
jgi:hypothetical protein